MKKIIFALILFSPFLALAEYSGVHIEFKIHLNDGKEIHGYKFITHGENNEEYKKNLEANPQIFLQNDYKFEPGKHSYYQKRLSYKNNDGFIYQLLEPTEINIQNIKSIVIISMIMSSYTTQIASEHKWEDRFWMQSEPISHYSHGEDLCYYETFIHQSEDIPTEVIEKIKLIIHQADTKIKEKELENEIISDQEYNELMKEIYDERSLSLKPFFDTYKGLKKVIISDCTC